MKKIIFNSSLPRSGSTLFQNIVAQNPEFYCTPTSGLADLVLASKNTYNNSQAMLAQDPAVMEIAFTGYCRAGIQGYFSGITDKPYVLEKSREWGVNYRLLEMVHEQPKIVCIVRDLRSIYSSMEKNFRKNPHKESHVQNVRELVGTTLKKRIDIWADSIPVGVSIDRLRDIIDQKMDSNILFIRYEDLMHNPEHELERFYDYVNLPYYEGHNFKKIVQITEENDVVHGIYGDHKLRSEFKRLPDDYDEILGFELSNAVKNTYEWFYKYFGYV